MSRPLRVPHEGLRAGEFELAEPAFRYVTRVHRLRAGDLLTLFDVGAGLEAEAELLDDQSGRVRVAACRSARRANVPVTLATALGKGDKPEQVVRDAATFGAARVIFVETERSIVRGARADKNARLERIAIETARQCGRGDVPEITGPLEWGAYLAEPGRGLRLVGCQVPASRPLLGLVDEAGRRAGAFPAIEMLIGPEGGLSPQEVEAALAGGFLPVSLGPLVLRTEVASGAVLAALWLYADGLAGKHQPQS
jgi:16S rRNA (uracil1498-N3)-methyltransferase